MLAVLNLTWQYYRNYLHIHCLIINAPLGPGFNKMIQWLVVLPTTDMEGYGLLAHIALETAHWWQLYCDCYVYISYKHWIRDYPWYDYTGDMFISKINTYHTKAWTNIHAFITAAYLNIYIYF